MRILILGAVLAMIALVACSGGEGPTAEGPSAETSPQPVATEVEITTSGRDGPATVEPAEATATDTGTASSLAESPGGDVVAVPPESEASTPEMETLPTAGSVDPSPTAEPEPSIDWRELPTPLEEFADFPDDVALVYFDRWMCYEGCSRLNPLYRIYRQDGELVREELLADDHPVYGRTAISVPDGSRMVATVCRDGSCYPAGLPPLGTTDLHESLDGGLSWHHLDTLDRPWQAVAITQDTLLLSSFNFRVPVWGADLFWPSMELDVWTEREPWPTRGEFEAMRAEIEGHDRDTIFVDLTGELPSRWDQFGNMEYRILPVSVQHGPFLRVVDVGEDCLPIRTNHSPDAEQVACMAERVLLQEQGDVATDEDITWRGVKTPAGIEGWANGRYLE